MARILESVLTTTKQSLVMAPSSPFSSFSFFLFFFFIFFFLVFAVKEGGYSSAYFNVLGDAKLETLDAIHNIHCLV